MRPTRPRCARGSRRRGSWTICCASASPTGPVPGRASWNGTNRCSSRSPLGRGPSCAISTTTCPCARRVSTRMRPPAETLVERVLQHVVEAPGASSRRRAAARQVGGEPLEQPHPARASASVPRQRRAEELVQLASARRGLAGARTAAARRAGARGARPRAGRSRGTRDAGRPRPALAHAPREAAIEASGVRLVRRAGRQLAERGEALRRRPSCLRVSASRSSARRTRSDSAAWASTAPSVPAIASAKRRSSRSKPAGLGGSRARPAPTARGSRGRGEPGARTGASRAAPKPRAAGIDVRVGGSRRAPRAPSDRAARSAPAARARAPRAAGRSDRPRHARSRAGGVARSPEVRHSTPPRQDSDCVAARTRSASSLRRLVACTALLPDSSSVASWLRALGERARRPGPFDRRAREARHVTEARHVPVVHARAGEGAIGDQQRDGTSGRRAPARRRTPRARGRRPTRRPRPRRSRSTRPRPRGTGRAARRRRGASGSDSARTRAVAAAPRLECVVIEVAQGREQVGLRQLEAGDPAGLVRVGGADGVATDQFSPRRLVDEQERNG